MTKRDIRSKELIRGEDLFSQGSLEEAKKCFLKLVNGPNPCKEALNNLGVLAYQQGNLPVPDTYREIVANLSILPAFRKETVEALARWVRLRNIISHEYLDVKWDSIKKIILDGYGLFYDFLNATNDYLTSKENEM